MPTTQLRARLLLHNRLRPTLAARPPLRPATRLVRPAARSQLRRPDPGLVHVRVVQRWDDGHGAGCAAELLRLRWWRRAVGCDVWYGTGGQVRGVRFFEREWRDSQGVWAG